MSAPKHSTHRGWTEEQLDLIRKEWGRGVTADRIAAQIPGKTRAAVLGVIYRNRFAGPLQRRTTKWSAQPVTFKAGPKSPEAVRRMQVTQYAERSGPYRHIEPAPITIAGPEWSWPSRRAA